MERKTKEGKKKESRARDRGEINKKNFRLMEEERDGEKEQHCILSPLKIGRGRGPGTHLAHTVPASWRSHDRICPGGGAGNVIESALLYMSWGVLPSSSDFQLQETSQGWPFCLLIREIELIVLEDTDFTVR